jgi:hypothetical protein
MEKAKSIDETIKRIDHLILKSDKIKVENKNSRKKAAKFGIYLLTATLLSCAAIKGYDSFQNLKEKKNEQYMQDYKQIIDRLENNNNWSAYESSKNLISKLKDTRLFPNEEILIETRKLKSIAKTEIKEDELAELVNIEHRFDKVKSHVANERYELAERNIVDILTSVSDGITDESKQMHEQVELYQGKTLEPKKREVSKYIQAVEKRFEYYQTILSTGDVYTILKVHKDCKKLRNIVSKRKFSKVSSFISSIDKYSGRFQNKITSLEENRFEKYKYRMAAVDRLSESRQYDKARKMLTNLKKDIRADKKNGLFSGNYFKEAK